MRSCTASRGGASPDAFNDYRSDAFLARLLALVTGLIFYVPAKARAVARRLGLAEPAVWVCGSVSSPVMLSTQVGTWALLESFEIYTDGASLRSVTPITAA